MYPAIGHGISQERRYGGLRTCISNHPLVSLMNLLHGASILLCKPRAEGWGAAWRVEYCANDRSAIGAKGPSRATWPT